MRKQLLPWAVGLVLLAPAAGAHAAGRVYAGQPSGGPDALMVLETSASNDAFERLTIAYRLACDTGGSYWIGGMMKLASPTPPAIPGQDPTLYGTLGPDGALSLGMASAPRLSTALSSTESFTLTGRLDATSGSGTLSATVKVYDNTKTPAELIATCAGTTPWRAIRNPGRVFGGHTSQGSPAVLELAPGRRRISHVHITTFAPCPVGGFWADRHNEFNWHSFRLTPGKTFRESFRPSRVEKVRMTGRFYGSRATGTLRWQVLETNETCDSGPLTWFAATG